MLKRAISIFIILLGVHQGVFAHNTDDHGKEIRYVLFADQIYKYDRAEPLLMATALCLDYYRSDDKKDPYFDKLRRDGVPNVPEAHLLRYTASGRNHQRYTHLGWNHSYIDNRGNWEMRKQMLVSTVNHVFKFSRNERIKADSFAALLYEIHILGDHIGDKYSSSATRIRLCSEHGYKGQVMPSTSDGRFVNPTLITYLIYHIERLFREQKDTNEYKALLEFLHSKKDLYIQTQITADNYDVTIRRLAEEIKMEMAKYIPILLKREPFFSRVFY